MKQKEKEFIVVTIINCIIFSILAYYSWLWLDWSSFLILLPGIIITEYLILRSIDKRYLIAEKQKLIQLGLVSASDYQIVSNDSGNEMGQFKNFLRLNLADLNEYLLSLEEAYRESLLLLDKGDIHDAKFKFNTVYEDIQEKVTEMETDLQVFIDEFPIPEEKEQNFLYTSYKEQWISEKSKKLKQITDLNEKFKVRCQFGVHLEDILRFEIENQRAITDSDIKDMKFPYHQAKQIIKFIEKPINFKIEEVSIEDKQKYGTLGRKIIETCSKKQITPNLPILVVELGIAIQESKKILSYLRSVGMIDQVYMHYQK